MRNRMFRRLFQSTTAVAAVAVLCLAHTASAAPWADPAGSNATVSYAGGANSSDAFPSPIVGSNAGQTSFNFAPLSSFQVVLNTAGFDEREDTATVTITAQPGYTLQSVYGRVNGNWAILGLSEAEVLAAGSLKVDDSAPVAMTFSTGPDNTGSPLSLPYTHEAESSLYSTQTFYGWVEIPLAPGTTEVTLQYFNRLWAFSDGSAVDLYNLASEFGVVAVVPEPASLAAVALGGLAILTRRRRA